MYAMIRGKRGTSGCKAFPLVMGQDWMSYGAVPPGDGQKRKRTAEQGDLRIDGVAPKQMEGVCRASCHERQTAPLISVVFVRGFSMRVCAYCHRQQMGRFHVIFMAQTALGRKRLWRSNGSLEILCSNYKQRKSLSVLRVFLQTGPMYDTLALP